jgi:hypothetical protein
MTTERALAYRELAIAGALALHSVSSSYTMRLKSVSSPNRFHSNGSTISTCLGKSMDEFKKARGEFETELQRDPNEMERPTLQESKAQRETPQSTRQPVGLTSDDE